jgi:c-di-GMP-binding flagellar brake protein YcgR
VNSTMTKIPLPECKSLSPLQIGRECYLKSVGRVVVVEILGINKETIWVSFPTADSIGEGTGVELVFHDAEGFMTFHARVAVGPKNTSSGIMLQRAESPSHMKKRRDWRVPTDFSIWIRHQGSSKKHKGVMRDLTAHGASIATQAALEAGDILKMTLKFPDSLPQTVSVQIVYADKTKDDAANRFGVRFIDMEKPIRESITWYLYEKIQEIYPNQLRALYPSPSR